MAVPLCCVYAVPYDPDRSDYSECVTRLSVSFGSVEDWEACREQPVLYAASNVALTYKFRGLDINGEGGKAREVAIGEVIDTLSVIRVVSFKTPLESQVSSIFLPEHYCLSARLAFNNAGALWVPLFLYSPGHHLFTGFRQRDDDS